jgi:hypothetical protein
MSIRTLLACVMLAGAGLSATDELPSESEIISVSPVAEKGKVAMGSAQVFTHPFARHFLWDVGCAGDWLQLEDGSTWTVAYDVRYEVALWWPDDVVYIAPSMGYSGYRYMIINETRGVYVYVNPKVKPHQYGAYTKYIVSIDYISGHVYLNDGTIWYISSIDLHLLSHWFVNDTVIIGVNSKVDNYSSPFILINASTYVDEWAACSLCN